MSGKIQLKMVTKSELLVTKIAYSQDFSLGTHRQRQDFNRSIFAADEFLANDTKQSWIRGLLGLWGMESSTIHTILKAISD